MPVFYLIKYGQNTKFNENDQISFLIKQLNLESDELFLPKDCEKIIRNLITRLGLRKSVHFFSQSKYEFASLKDSIENLTLVSVFIRILYNEKLLSYQEISKFRHFLQNISFINEKSQDNNPFLLSFVPLKLSASITSDASIENELSDIKKSKGSEDYNKQSPPKSLLKNLEESKISPK